MICTLALLFPKWSPRHIFYILFSYCSVAIPELLPIDLRVKLGICLIQNKYDSLAEVFFHV